jgi:hypothetical protein
MACGLKHAGLAQSRPRPGEATLRLAISETQARTDIHTGKRKKEKKLVKTEKETKISCEK